MKVCGTSLAQCGLAAQRENSSRKPKSFSLNLRMSVLSHLPLAGRSILRPQGPGTPRLAHRRLPITSRLAPRLTSRESVLEFLGVFWRVI